MLDRTPVEVAIGGIYGLRGKLPLPPLPGSGWDGATRPALPTPAQGGGATGYLPSPAIATAAIALPSIAGFPPAFTAWALRLVDVVNNTLRGKINVTLNVTLNANAAETVVIDARVGVFSFLHFMPLTADAATELVSGSLYVSAQTNGQFTVAHTNNAQTDRAFRVLIIG